MTEVQFLTHHFARHNQDGLPVGLFILLRLEEIRDQTLVSIGA